MDVDVGDLVMINRPIAFDDKKRLGGLLIGYGMLALDHTLNENIGIVLNDHVGAIDTMAVVLIERKYMGIWKDYLTVLEKLDV